MRTLRPYIAAAPLCYQPLLLASRIPEKRLGTLEQQKDNLKDQLGALKMENGRFKMTLDCLKKESEQAFNRYLKMPAKRCFKLAEARVPERFSLLFTVARHLLKR